MAYRPASLQGPVASAAGGVVGGAVVGGSVDVGGSVGGGTVVEDVELEVEVVLGVPGASPSAWPSLPAGLVKASPVYGPYATNLGRRGRMLVTV